VQVCRKIADRNQDDPEGEHSMSLDEFVKTLLKERQEGT
jgi:hypothetical protein